MTKSEARKARKAGQLIDWHLDVPHGRPEMVRERTAREEARHARRMYRLARLTYEYDRDF